MVWSDGCEEGEGKGCVYVLDNFDRPCYKSLLDKRRLVGPAVVLAHLSNGWVSDHAAAAAAPLFTVSPSTASSSQHAASLQPGDAGSGGLLHAGRQP